MMRRLEYERIRKGVARTKLSAKAKLSRGRVGQIEMGRVTPPRDSKELQRLARALGLHVKAAPELIEVVSEAEEAEALALERAQKETAYGLSA